MPLRLMIDSGAFTVWNSGGKIDLDEYIKFCKERPHLSVIVGLDVIPPKKAKLTDELKDAVAAEGWSNYLKMIRHLPMEKVVSVFHRGDSFKWLEKMLDFGCPYIGLSPRHDGTGSARRDRFLNESKKYIYDSTGNPTTNVHGFAVTNHKMMMDFKWYSVDSASYTQVASWGGILVPPLRNGQWDFKSKPYRVFCSSISPGRHDANHHLLAMRDQRPALYSTIMKWLHENGVDLGTHDIVDAGGRKPKTVIERWENKEKTRILKIKERGVTNCDQVRRWINAVYFHRVNDSLDTVRHLFLAGNGPNPPVLEQIRYKLMSYTEGRNVHDWFYNRIGKWQQPFQFPFHLYDGSQVSFSFKEPSCE